MTGILIDADTGDLMIKNGALVLGDTTGQTVEHVLIANRGEYKEYPLVGGEVDRMRNGMPDPFWRGRFKEMLNSCGVKVTRLDVNNGNINIEW